MKETFSSVYRSIRRCEWHYTSALSYTEMRTCPHIQFLVDVWLNKQNSWQFQRDMHTQN